MSLVVSSLMLQVTPLAPVTLEVSHPKWVVSGFPLWLWMLF